MGLFKGAILNTFGFWRQYLGKLVLYQLFFSIFIAIGIIMIFPLFLIFLTQLAPFIQMSPTLSNLFTLLSETTLLNTIPMPFWISLAVIGFIIVVIFGIAQAGGYPLLLKQAGREKKISIIKAFKGGLKKIHKVFSVTMIIVFPFLILGVISIFLITTLGGITGIVSMILICLALIIAGSYISIRLILSIPVLMIEDSGIIESIKRSWKMTKSKFWVLFGIIIIVGLIIGIISYILDLIPFVGYIANFLVFSPISGIVSTVVYYTMKSKISRKKK